MKRITRDALLLCLQIPALACTGPMDELAHVEGSQVRSVGPTGVTTCSVPDEFHYLNGLDVAWVANGEGALAADATSPITSLVLTAPPTRAVRVRVEARARFGPMDTGLLYQTYDIPMCTTQGVEIDLGPALAMAPEQVDYVTTILVSVALVDGSGNVLARKGLLGRYLAVEATGPGRVFDSNVYAQSYADGFTNEPARQAYLDSQLASANDAVFLGVGPGLYQSSTTGSGSTSGFVKMCFEYQTNFDDKDGGDFWTSYADKDARGVFIRVWDSNGLKYSGFTRHSTGCTHRMLLSGPHEIRAYTMARVGNGNDVNVLREDGWPYSYTVASQFTPNGSGTYTFTIANPASGAERNVMNAAAGAGYAVYKRPVGLSNETFNVLNRNCPDGDKGSCSRDGGATVYLSGNGKARKFILTHELGHAVASKRDEHQQTDNDTGGRSALCPSYGGNDGPSHDFVSEERQSAAIKEGFGHFYAASVFNDSQESSCEFTTYTTIDFERNGEEFYGATISCENGADYQAEYCGENAGMAVEFDWLRFFWDMHTDAGLSATKLADIYDAADAKNWDDDDQVGPYERLRNAAIAEGVSETTWDAWADWNGVNR